MSDLEQNEEQNGEQNGRRRRGSTRSPWVIRSTRASRQGAGSDLVNEPFPSRGTLTTARRGARTARGRGRGNGDSDPQATAGASTTEPVPVNGVHVHHDNGYQPHDPDNTVADPPHNSTAGWSYGQESAPPQTNGTNSTGPAHPLGLAITIPYSRGAGSSRGATRGSHGTTARGSRGTTTRGSRGTTARGSRSTSTRGSRGGATRGSHSGPISTPIATTGDHWCFPSAPSPINTTALVPPGEYNPPPPQQIPAVIPIIIGEAIVHHPLPPLVDARVYQFPNFRTRLARTSAAQYLTFHMMGEQLYFSPVAALHPPPVDPTASEDEERRGRDRRPRDVRVLDLFPGATWWARQLRLGYPQTDVTIVDRNRLDMPGDMGVLQADVDGPMEWDWPDERFDFVHGRSLECKTIDLKYVLNRVFDSLKPGGWFESHEMEDVIRSDDDPILERAACSWNWNTFMGARARNAREATSRNLRIWDAALLRSVGFENVTVEFARVPIGLWVGRLDRMGVGILMTLILQLSMIPYLQDFVWTMPETSSLNTEERVFRATQQELTDPDQRLYMYMAVVRGQKPSSGPTSML